MTFLDEAIKEQANPQTSRPTRTALAKNAADACKQLSVQATLQFVQNLNQGFDLIWNNPNSLSPQEVVDQLGTDAAEVFANHAATVAYLVNRAPATAALFSRTPEDAVIKANEDGTITITYANPE